MNDNLLLAQFIRLVVESYRAPSRGQPWPGTSHEHDEPEEDKISRSASPIDWRSNQDSAFEQQVEELVDMPEFQTIDSFVNYKLDNDEFVFSTAELQALARAAESQRLERKVAAVSSPVVAALKKTLVDEFGFKFEPRQRSKFVRGSMSSAHGTHPFAGAGGGGSGLGSDFGGSTFTSFGGGPGAIGGGYEWNKDDKRNLPMGAARRKR